MSRDRRLYGGSYPRRAKAVRDAANANPYTTCQAPVAPGGPLCGLRLDQHPPGDSWTAGHVVPHDFHSDLVPQARSCNVREGNHRRKQPPSNPHSVSW